MKFGVREICDVVLKAKATMKVGNKIFYANEPVVYFDTLKTSSLEGASTTVYAQGGRGNSRLMAWEGERTVTFTMEDALISPESFMILSGAGLIEADNSTKIYQHATQIIPRIKTEVVDPSEPDTADAGDDLLADLDMDKWNGAAPYAGQNGNYIYGMFMYEGEIISEPYILNYNSGKFSIAATNLDNPEESNEYTGSAWLNDDENATVAAWNAMLIDYYIERSGNARQIDITPESFGGNFYLEASTLFRDTNGVDMPAEFIIPNCKVQSNFTFTMASSGDPSTFTFTMDAFPDYTRFDNTKKVLASIQIIDSEDADVYGKYRQSTKAVEDEEE